MAGSRYHARGAVLPNQDSEKDETMIGTLAVSLPSSCAGGKLAGPSASGADNDSGQNASG